MPADGPAQRIDVPEVLNFVGVLAGLPLVLLGIGLLRFHLHRSSPFVGNTAGSVSG